jgi:hypothetical protein
MRSEIISYLLEGTLCSLELCATLFEEQMYYSSASSQTGSLLVASIFKPADSHCVALPRVTQPLLKLLDGVPDVWRP